MAGPVVRKCTLQAFGFAYWLSHTNRSFAATSVAHAVQPGAEESGDRVRFDNRVHFRAERLHEALRTARLHRQSVTQTNR